MIKGIDTARSQWEPRLNLNLPWADGHRVNYVKMGGDNNPRYIGYYYHGLVDNSRAIGYRIGHYWVPDARKDPAGAANFYVDNLRNWTPQDFAVLDNESFRGNDPDGPGGPLQDSLRYSDQQVAAWVHTVKTRLGIPGNQVLVYSGLADARGSDWTRTLATGANFIIAAYSYGPFEFSLPNIPADRVVGHQTGGIIYGGVPTDVNSFKDHAFNYDTGSEDMTPEQDTKLNSIFDAIFYGGDSMEDNKQSISRSLAQINAKTVTLSDEDIERIVAALPTGTLTKADVVDAIKSVKFVAQ